MLGLLIEPTIIKSKILDFKVFSFFTCSCKKVHVRIEWSNNTILDLFLMMSHFHNYLSSNHGIGFFPLMFGMEKLFRPHKENISVTSQWIRCFISFRELYSIVSIFPQKRMKLSLKWKENSTFLVNITNTLLGQTKMKNIKLNLNQMFLTSSYCQVSWIMT